MRKKRKRSRRHHRSVVKEEACTGAPERARRGRGRTTGGAFVDDVGRQHLPPRRRHRHRHRRRCCCCCCRCRCHQSSRTTSLSTPPHHDEREGIDIDDDVAAAGHGRPGGAEATAGTRDAFSFLDRFPPLLPFISSKNMKRFHPSDEKEGNNNRCNSGAEILPSLPPTPDFIFTSKNTHTHTAWCVPSCAPRRLRSPQRAAGEGVRRNKHSHTDASSRAAAAQTLARECYFFLGEEKKKRFERVTPCCRRHKKK